MRIDAHQHYWKIERGDYGWITPDIPVLFRDFLPEHLEPHLSRHRLDGTIVVQAAPTLEETEFLLALADRSPSILGVVGWFDLFDPNHRSHYRKFRSHPKFVGFRIMIQEMPDASRILEPEFVEALRGYSLEDVPVDLLVRCDQLEATIRLLRQVPELRGVIDHIAKPRIKDGIMEPWLSQMREIAGFPNIRCKLSGMVTEADYAGWRPEHFNAYIRYVVDLFGPERVLFGSDWPVCLLAADYDQVVDVLEQALPDGWGDTERAKLFGENAREFYKL
jgi:L-fuconolactonase